MEYELNHEEFEKQKRQNILDSDKYLLFEILIGTETEEVLGHIGNAPCVTIEMKHIGPEQISILYVSLLQMIKYLEKDYPKECVIAKLTKKCKDLGEYEYNPDKKEDKK